MTKYIERGGEKIAIVTGLKISCQADALDIMAEAFQNGCCRLVFHMDDFSDQFFDLKSGMAGRILQKFSNYGFKLAIVGDFKNVKSRSLAAFIYECNRGMQVFFKSAEEEAARAF